MLLLWLKQTSSMAIFVNFGLELFSVGNSFPSYSTHITLSTVFKSQFLSSENEMTVVKFRISSYFAQISSIVSCFRKYHSKVLKRFSFFEIEESWKIAILTPSRYRKWLKNVHFRFAHTAGSTRWYLAISFGHIIV